MHEKVIFVGSKSAVPLPHTGVKPRDDLPGSPFLRINRDAKCLGPRLPDTFSARGAELTGLKMRRITRGVSLDHLVGADQKRLGDYESQRFGGLGVHHHLEFDR